MSHASHVERTLVRSHRQAMELIYAARRALFAELGPDDARKMGGVDYLLGRAIDTLGAGWELYERRGDG
jgi:hypothetical protein